MKKVHILVEGQTEERFVNDILAKYFSSKEVYLNPIVSTTKRIKSGKKFRGGITSYKKIKQDILPLINDTSSILVTTMIDLYGLPSDFPGKANAPSQPDHLLSHLESAFESDINSKKFKAFFVKYEFEGLLFSNPDEIAKKLTNKKLLKELWKIRKSFETPEDINNNPSTAPSKRILRLFNDYDKVSDGAIIANRIGLPVLRKECKHFDKWITFIENI